MDKVKEMMAAGISLSTAIRESIDGSMTAFADRNGLNRSMTSEVFNLARTPDGRTCDALSRELGGSAYEWAMLLWEQARPAESAFAATSASAESAAP